MNATIYSFPHKVYLLKITPDTGRAWYTRLRASSTKHLDKRIKTLYPASYQVVIMGTVSNGGDSW